MAEQEKLSLRDLVQGIRAVSDSRGAAPLHALVRQGAHELTPLLAAFPDSNVRPVEEPGQMLNPTPQLVTESLTGRKVNLQHDRVEPQQKKSKADLQKHAEERAQAADQRMEQGRQHGSQGMGM